VASGDLDELAAPSDDSDVLVVTDDLAKGTGDNPFADDVEADSDGAIDEEKGPSFVRRHASGVFVALAAIVTVGLVVLYFVVFAFGLSAVQEHRNQKQLYRTMRGLVNPASPVAPWTGGVIPAGSPVALITTKAGNMSNLVVVEGSSSDQMRDGPGHLPDSPLPGQVGDSIVIGRSTTTGAPFGSVPSMRKGDTLTVITGQGTFHYRVEDVRIAGAKLPKIPNSGSLLTLVTSTGPGALGSLLDGHLVYVDAALKGRAVVTPKGRPTSVSPADVQGHGDLGALGAVLFWMVLVAGSLLASVWLVARWGWRRAWLLIAPIIIAAGWGLSDQLLRLVPNVT